MDYSKILNEKFNIKVLKDKQKEIVDSVLNEEDVIGILPTGYGKSICFQLPSLIFDGITLVISPLIALMQDQVYSLNKKGIEACYINSSLSYDKIKEEYLRIKKGKYKIIYVAGERLESFEFIRLMKEVKISLITIDEAHTLVWGDTFRLSLSRIYEFIKLLQINVPILALTATASTYVLTRIKEILNIKNAKIVSASLDRENIFYMTRIVKDKNKELISFIKSHPSELGIIYCLTVRRTTYVYNYLSNLGFKVGIYHGKLNNDIKNETINNFICDNYDVIVCTSAFGMGIDKPNVRYVINYDLPLSMEELSQELGRCGRDGKKAISVLFFSPQDIKTCNYFIEQMNNNNVSLKENIEIKRKANQNVSKVIDYATTRSCLHRFILKHFGQDLKSKCNNCSNCIRLK